jgi:hypothetical protein
MAKWLRQRSAKPLFPSSNLGAASNELKGLGKLKPNPFSLDATLFGCRFLASKEPQMENGVPFDHGLPDPIQPEPSARGLLKGFLGTARAILLSPRTFFPSMPVEGGLVGPYVFFLFCTTFSFVASICLTLAMSGGISLWILLVMFAAVWMPFVSAAILNFLFTKLLRSGGSYEATFRVVCYASAVNLFAWVPAFLVILLLQCYEIYLSALGLSIVHRTSIGQALLVVIGALLTISVIIGLVARVFFPL